MKILAFIVLCLGLSVPVNANDSMAELGTGGLTLARTDKVAILREKLFISLNEIRVDYVFKNNSEDNVETIVAFPMPDLIASPYESIALPGDAKDNFLDFSVEINGKAVTPNLQQRAFAVGLDVTQLLRDARISLVPYADGMQKALNALPGDIVTDFENRGIVTIDSYDAGQGMQHDVAPIWTLKSAYWWKMRFPAGQTISISHHYRPSVGGTAALTFVNSDGSKGPNYKDYQQKYCIDEGFYPAAVRRVKKAGDNGPYYYENRLSYILVSGANWAGPIGEFHLIFDKGSTKNLIAFCGDGVSKTGPTRFEMKIKDFIPERDLDVLYMVTSQ